MIIYKVCKQQLGLGNKGVAALLTIIIISAATLIMAYSASLLGLGELDMGYTSQKGGETFSVAGGCAEEALNRLRFNSGYTGANLSLGEGSCIITVSTVSDISTINVIANINNNYYKKLEVVVDLAQSPITIASWEEKND